MLAAAPVLVLAAAAARSPRATDFMCFWTGARLVANGVDPYDGDAWSAAISGIFTYPLGGATTAPCPGRYGYPLSTALATLPFGLVPIEAAAIVWMILLVLGIGVGTALLGRAAGLARRDAVMLIAIVLASQPAWLTALTAQYGGLELVALGLIVLPATVTRPGLFSVATLLLVLKPHVAPIVVIERAAAASMRSRVAAGAVVGLLVAASLVVRPSWPVEWLSELGGHRAAMMAGTPTLWGFATWITGRSEIALLVVAAVVTGFALALRGTRPWDPLDRVAVTLSAWLIVVPYLSTADAVVLAVVWCAILRRAVAAPRSAALLVALVVVASLVPWSLYAMKDTVASDIRNGLVIPATAALLAVALRRRYAPAVAPRNEPSVVPA